MRRNVILIMFLLVAIPLFFTPTLVKAVGDSQEESFAVTPLPFLDYDYITGTTLEYDNQKVINTYDSDDATSDDSILFFNETTPENVMYNPDFDLDYDETTNAKFVNSLSSVLTWSSGGTDWNTWENINGGLHARYDSVSPNEYPLRNCKQSSEGYPDTSTYDGSSDWTWYLYFMVDYTDTADYFRLGIREYNGGGNSDWFDFKDYSKNEWHYVEYKPLVAMADNERIDINAQLDAGEYAELWLMWIACLNDETNPNLDEIFEGGYYREGFNDVSDWDSWSNFVHVDDTFTTDDDILTKNNDWGGGTDYDYIYTDSPSIDTSSGDWYYEFRFKCTTQDTFAVYFRTTDGEGSANQNIQTEEETDWTTYKGLVTIDTIESIALIDIDNDGDSTTYLEYFRVAESDKMGWQYDASTIEGNFDAGGIWGYADSSDGDNLTLTITKTSGTGNSWSDYRIPVDTTTTKAEINIDIYQFIDVYWRCTAMTTENVYLTMYFDDYKMDGVIHTETFGWVHERYNIGVMTSSYAIADALRFTAKGDATNEAVTVEVNYAQVYSIADFTIIQSVTTSDQVLFVEDGAINSIKSDSNYIELEYDIDILVNKNYFNLTISNIGSDSSGNDYGFRDDTWGTWTFHYFGSTTPPLDDFKIVIYESLTLSEILFFNFADSYLTAKVTPYKNQKIVTMLESTEQEGNITFTFLTDETLSNLTTVWNIGNYVTFGDSQIATSELIIRFEFLLQHSENYFSLKLSDNQTIKIGSLSTYDGLDKATNKINISFGNFTDVITMYHLTGDIEYKNDVVSTLYDDEIEGITTTDFGFNWIGEYIGATGAVEYLHRTEYFVSGFQYVRFKPAIIGDTFGYAAYPDDTINVYMIFTQYFYDAEGNIEYTIVLDNFEEFDGVLGTSGYTLTITNSTSDTVYEKYLNDDGEPDPIRLGLFAVWRDDNNYLNVKQNEEYFLTDNEDSWFYWISEEPLENFQSKIRIDKHAGMDSNGLQITLTVSFGEFELSHTNLKGVAEPHFSSTWWEGIPIVQQLIEGFIFLGDIIGRGLILMGEGLVNIFSPILDVIATAIGAIAASAWALFGGILDDIYGVLGGIGAAVWGLFETILDNIDSGLDLLLANTQGFFENAIGNMLIPLLEAGASNIVDAIITALAALIVGAANIIGNALGNPTFGDDIASLFVNFGAAFEAFGSFFDLIINQILPTVLDALIFIASISDEAFLLIGAIIGVDIAISIIDADYDGLTKYLKLISWVGEKMFSLVNMVVTFIGGVIP